MPDTIVKQTLREVEPLRTDERVQDAAEKVLASGLPGLPVVDERGKFAGIFGEREFIGAFFPGYVGELGSSAMIRRPIDDTIERRLGCRNERIAQHLTTDQVLVEEDYSDTQLAELFLHHRVLIVPIASQGRVHAVVTRSDFFKAMVEKLESASPETTE